MFVRQLKNRSGSTSVQVISKSHGKYKVHKTIGSATTQQKIEELVLLAKQEIKNVEKQHELFVSKEDTIANKLVETLSNASIRTLGPEIIFGKIYNFIGFNQINEEMFRHLVISRMAFPLSKLKTIEYLYRYQGVSHDIDAIYRFLDKLNNKLKHQVEQIAFSHTLRILRGQISVVLRYDNFVF